MPVTGVSGVACGRGSRPWLGVRAAGVACGLKKNGRPDLALVVSDTPAHRGSHVHAESRAGGPDPACRSGISRGGRFSAIVLNSGNANACTGRQGLADAEATAAEVADILGRPVGQVFVASTGVIGRPLDMAAIRAGIRAAARS